MSRHNLTDREWKSIRVFLPSERPARPGRPWIPHRQVMNGILFVLVTGKVKKLRRTPSTAIFSTAAST